MARQVTYVPDRRGTARFARSAEVSRISVRAAEAARAFAEATAPVRTGRYRGAFTVEKAMVLVGGERRAGAVLRVSVDYALPVEARRQVLSRAAEWVEQSSRSSRVPQ